MRDFVILLTKSKLVEKLETWRTEDKDIDWEQWMEPFPNTDDNEPSAVLTFSLSQRVDKEEKRFEEPVIWTVAPESMIQGLEEDAVKEGSKFCFGELGKWSVLIKQKKIWKFIFQKH